jgi:hypothetical protein
MPLNSIAAVPLLASLVLSYRADSGTVYVAADSRITTAHFLSSSLPETGSNRPNDSGCKIRVLNGGVVFVGTGTTLFSANGHKTNIYTIAADAASHLPPVPLQAADIRRMALEWQTAVRVRLQSRLSASSQGSAPESVAGTTGSFYAATEDSGVYAVTARIAPRGHQIESIEEPQPPSGYMVATGTEVAKHDALEIAANPASALLPWPRRLQSIEARTIREEALRYGARSTIGGPIDLIEITPQGPLWLARKPTCR